MAYCRAVGMRPRHSQAVAARAHCEERCRGSLYELWNMRPRHSQAVAARAHSEDTRLDNASSRINLRRTGVLGEKNAMPSLTAKPNREYKEISH